VKEKLKREFLEKRDQFERRNLGGYEMIYPTLDEAEMQGYQKLMDVAKEIWDNQHGIAKARRKEAEASKFLK
jgi:hypothetical protein